MQKGPLIIASTVLLLEACHCSGSNRCRTMSLQKLCSECPDYEEKLQELVNGDTGPFDIYTGKCAAPDQYLFIIALGYDNGADWFFDQNTNELVGKIGGNEECFSYGKTDFECYPDSVTCYGHYFDGEPLNPEDTANICNYY